MFRLAGRPNARGSKSKSAAAATTPTPAIDLRHYRYIVIEVAGLNNKGNAINRVVIADTPTCEKTGFESFRGFC